jgi:hypothetical protein
MGTASIQSFEPLAEDISILVTALLSIKVGLPVSSKNFIVLLADDLIDLFFIAGSFSCFSF